MSFFRSLGLVGSLLTACSLFAQQGTAVMHRFKYFAPGQYKQTSQAYRGGQPVGELVVDTHCGGALSSQSGEALKQMQAMVAPNCSMQVTVDTPASAEWVQTCNPGAMQTVIRSTSRRVDDRTITIETNMSLGGQEQTATRSTLKYLGACPAGTAPPATLTVPAMPKPSAEDCAGLAEMRQQAKEATPESCHSADLPPAYVARCEASMKIMKEQVQRIEAMCKR